MLATVDEDVDHVVATDVGADCCLFEPPDTVVVGVLLGAPEVDSLVAVLFVVSYGAEVDVVVVGLVLAVLDSQIDAAVEVAAEADVDEC